ncbi:hypothetical protein [Thermoactinospora rubra]|uniref:hypothetical protein n=1 Tax=Thermoactinospora rubra TaxID=1088767 RepID=UPI0011808660|nr:hypothetical protein [Thermoactinospora rubra]
MDPRRLPPRLVIDPSLHPQVSVVLRESPSVLLQARQGRQPRTGSNPGLVFAVPAFLLLIFMIAGTGGVVLGGLGMSVFLLLRLAAVNGGTSKRLRLAWEHADRYVLPTDLDYPCQQLLRRAQDAVDAVLGSEVNRAGYIDTIDNRVTLPEEVWQIATRLARLSAMHREHRKLVPKELPPALDEAFKPYSTALDAAWTSLSKRVKQLERYAAQVRKADEVFQVHRRLEELAARTHDYQRLVADTVQDDLARAHIRELAQQAANARKLFEESIDQAKLAAGHLMRDSLT